MKTTVLIAITAATAAVLDGEQKTKKTKKEKMRTVWAKTLLIWSVFGGSLYEVQSGSYASQIAIKDSVSL